MLAYVLAIAVALGSFALYMSAFFFPEVYRKYDLLWSGVGMFYALVLWVCAGRITGGVLFGQVASVALMGWLGWQMLSLRRYFTPPGQRTHLPEGATSLGQLLRIRSRQIGQQLQRQWSFFPGLGTLGKRSPVPESPLVPPSSPTSPPVSPIRPTSKPRPTSMVIPEYEEPESSESSFMPSKEERSPQSHP